MKIFKTQLKRIVIMERIDDFYENKDNENFDKLIKCIEKEIYSHKYKRNIDYLLVGRKKDLVEELNLILNKKDRWEMIKSCDEKKWELIRVLVQFINEGSKAYPQDIDRIKYVNDIDYNELKKKCDRYTLEGIICLEEKQDILNMLEKIKNYIVKIKEKNKRSN